MTKDLIPSPAHQKLTTGTLNAAVDVLEFTCKLDPYEEKKNEETGQMERVLNLRINGQRVRAALGVVSVVERLGDQALRRQAGTALKGILKAIKDAQKNQGSPPSGKKAGEHLPVIDASRP